MVFRLSLRSLARLNGVHTDLVKVVEEAIKITPLDFMVTEGLRSMTRQAELVKAGASKTMNSRHLTGHAVDVAALVAGKVRWDWPLYAELARYFRQAARIQGVSVIWGGCWDKLLNEIDDPAVAADDYSARMRANGKRPLIDGPHYELARSRYQ